MTKNLVPNKEGFPGPVGAYVGALPFLWRSGRRGQLAILGIFVVLGAIAAAFVIW